MNSLSLRLSRAMVGVAFAFVALDVPAGPVNINTADAATLARELKGVGLKRAQSIVEYRSKHGPFRSADELALVKGLGKVAIDRNRAEIRVDGARPVARPSGAPASLAPAKR